MAVIKKTDVGTLFDKNALLLMIAVGDAAAEDGTLAYQILCSNGYQPAIKSVKTGKMFVFSWEHIIAMAKEQGIDDDPS